MTTLVAWGSMGGRVSAGRSHRHPAFNRGVTVSDFDDRLDDYDDGREPCPQCGKPMSSDVDGDGVMAMSYEFCEDCGTKDYGEPVRLTEQLFAFARENGLMEK